MLASAMAACSSSKTASASGGVADDYGYSEKNPIKVGGFNNGPANERRYLDRLTGPNGEPTTYIRRGSCCMFKSKSSPMGSGMLDIYEVTIAGDSEKKVLYLNMYDSDKLHAPKGFLIK